MEYKAEKYLKIIIIHLAGILLIYCMQEIISGDGRTDFSKKISLPFSAPIDSTIHRDKMEIKIKILYDNASLDNKFEKGWGFSCLINDSVLFDTGESWDKLGKNIRSLDVKTELIRHIVISHGHNDHTGGLEGVLNVSSNIEDICFFPGADEKLLKLAMKRNIKILFADSVLRIAGNIYSGGALICDYKGKSLNEQFLIIENNNSIIIITGCAHPGILNIVKKVREDFPKGKISLVLGGFHLGGESGKNIKIIAEELLSAGVEKLAPCHCTGKKAIKIFDDIFGDKFVDVRAGSCLTFEL